MQNLAAELEREQAYVDMLYRRLDTLRERAQGELERALGTDGGGNVHPPGGRGRRAPPPTAGAWPSWPRPSTACASAGWTGPTAASCTSAASGCSTTTANRCWSTGAPPAPTPP